MSSFLLALSYRVFRNPFAGWALLALTIMLLLTALLKCFCWIALPGALRPDTLRGFFQLAPFSAIPLAVYFGLAQFRWQQTFAARHPVMRWTTVRSLLAMALWLLLLLGLFRFNLAVFPH
ncbi:hypothetical protein [Flaviaesturariibacter terrae]